MSRKHSTLLKEEVDDEENSSGSDGVGKKREKDKDGGTALHVQNLITLPLADIQHVINILIYMYMYDKDIAKLSLLSNTPVLM